MDKLDLDSIDDFDEWCRVLAYKMNHYAFGAMYYESNPTKTEKRILDGLDRGIKNAARQRVADRAAKSNRDTWVSIQTVSDTCDYCTSRAGKWHRASGGFADAFHGFHSKCDCHVAVSFDKGENIEYRYRSDDAGIPLSYYTDAYGTKREAKKPYRPVHDSERPVAASFNFIHKNDKLYENVKYVEPEPGYVDYAIHSDGFEFDRFGPLPERSSQRIDAETLAEWIKLDPEYNGGDVRLLACMAGAYDDGAAQRLADVLGVKVKAPTDTIWINGKGQLAIASSDKDAYMIYSGKLQNGTWRIFEPRKAAER